MDSSQFAEIRKFAESQDKSSDMSWILILLMLMFSGNNIGIAEEESKMREDIAELKGKMSIIEKKL